MLEAQPVASRPLSREGHLRFASDIAKNFGALILGSLIFVVPVLVTLAREAWSLEQGSQGPIILISGTWLLLHEARGTAESPGRKALAISALIISLLVAVASRLLGMLWTQWLSCLGAFVAIYYAYAGRAGIRRIWFPLAYLTFLMPPPQAVSALFTDTLKGLIAAASIHVLTFLGFEAARSGTMLYIDQYELVVADACAGLNSIFSLLAVGLFYIYVRWRADWRYSALLAVLLLPVAVLANLLRVVILMLATHYAGDGVAQTFIHQPAGFLMFALALGTLVGIDALLSPLRRRWMTA